MSSSGIQLSQEMRQKQVMAPQMLQSLEILQLQSQDLAELVQKELDQNPTLELADISSESIDYDREEYERESSGDGAGAECDCESILEKLYDAEDKSESADLCDIVDYSSENLYGDEEYAAGAYDYAERNRDEYESSRRYDIGDGGEDSESSQDYLVGQQGNSESTEFSVLGQLDDLDYLYQQGNNNEYNPEADERRQFAFDSIQSPESLFDYLYSLISTMELTEHEQLIAEEIVGSLDKFGRVVTPLADIAQAVEGSTLEECERVLKIVQANAPAGIAARTLPECLLLQTSRMRELNPLVEIIIRDYLELVAVRQIAKIAKACKATVEDVEDALRMIARLNPAPGLDYVAYKTVYITPEVEVVKIDDVYRVRMLESNIPHLRVSPYYKTMLKSDGIDQHTRDYVNEKMRGSVNLIHNIEQRQETIQKVAQVIVDSQQAFFDVGASALKPLVMAEVAEKVGVHETTVSRAVNSKYMRSPQGTHELKFFFTRGVATEDGGAVSNEHVKQLIKSAVVAEDKEKPLSDDALVKMLSTHGLKIARRTVTKYREKMGILSSSKRRIRKS